MDLLKNSNPWVSSPYCIWPKSTLGSNFQSQEMEKQTSHKYIEALPISNLIIIDDYHETFLFMKYFSFIL